MYQIMYKKALVSGLVPKTLFFGGGPYAKAYIAM